MDERIGTRPRKLTIQNRAVGSITGIQDVVSFDENQAVLGADMGLPTVKGRDIYVNHLTLGKGGVDVKGTIDSLVYSSNASYRKSGESVFTRLFKQRYEGKVTGMNATINYEVRLLAISFLTGVGLLVVHDCLRVFRLLCPHSGIAVGIKDVLYWICSALIAFGLLYREDDGDIRAYAMASAFVGVALYQWLVSRNFPEYLKKLLKYFRMRTGKHRAKGQKK